MILTIVNKESKVACVTVKNRITRIKDTQVFFLFYELPRVDKDIKEILLKNKWTPVGPKELTKWQS